MTMIVSHISALEFWLAHRDAPPPHVRVRIPGKGPTAQEKEHFTREHARRFGSPVHLLAKSPWPSSADFQMHSSSAFEQGISAARLNKDVFVCTVELAFCQAATSLSFAELVFLGYELCGGYSIDRTACGGFFQRDPLTTPEKLTEFAIAHPSLRGSADAQRALRHVAAGAASPAESRLAMSLTLPMMRGGLGLPKAQLNYNIPLSVHAKRATGRHYFSCDMFWPEHNIAVEYDSDLAHTGSQRIANDSARRNALAFLDIQVVTVTRLEFNDRDRLNRLARMLARKMGKPIRIRGTRFDKAQIDLRRLLFEQPVWESRRHAKPLLSQGDALE